MTRRSRRWADRDLRLIDGRLGDDLIARDRRGTLVLAVATFSSARSANRSARVAEQSLMVGLRPVLIPSREEEPVERIRFGDGVFVSVPGHGAAAVHRDGVVYLSIAVRNGGSGVAVLHGWRARAREKSTAGCRRVRPPAA